MKLSEVYSRKILNSKPLSPPCRVHFFILITLIFFCGHPCSISDAQERLRFHFIDVGYGDALLLEFPGAHYVMIDAGTKAFAPRLVNYLQSLNIHSIHTAVITHPHTNHFEGFFEILKSIKIDRLYINGDENSEEGYESLLAVFESKNIPIAILRRGNIIDGLTGTTQLEVWHPKQLSGTPNGNSIVLRLKHNDVSALFMADIDLNPQNELFDLYPSMQTADIIKVPHHGGPLSKILFQALTNKVFVVSTGPNQWGWAHDNELQSLNGEVYRTDVHGTIVLESNGSSVSVKTSQKKVR